MKQFLLLFFLFSLSLVVLSAQGAAPVIGGTIKGKVFDENRQAIAYATISIMDIEGTLITGGITDEKGKFSLDNIPLGPHAVEIQFLGYQVFQQTFDLQKDKETLTLEDIYLAPSGIALDEVVVTAERSQYSLQLDRKVFNVGKDVLAQGANALDILNQVPQVAVDPNGTVTLRGSSQVQILVNGRRTGLTMNNAIDQIDGANIERIEVITNPSASFDASGSAGIINIVLKKNQDYGFKGEVSATVGAPANHIIRPSLLYKGPKLNFFANYRWRYSDYNGIYTSDQQNFSDTGITRLVKDEREDRHDDGRSFYVGGDYYWNDNNSVTLAFFRADTKDTDFTALSYDITDEQATSTLLREGNSLERRDYNQLEANYTRTYEQPGQRWTIDFQYDFWNSNKDWDLSTFGEQLPANVATGIRTNSKAGSRDYVLSTDYSYPLGETGKLQLGAKLENRIVTNDYLAENQVDDQWQVFRDFDNEVDYTEAIGAAYVEYQNKLGELEYKVGLRSEYTQIDISDAENTFTQDKEYLNWFPSAFLSYNISENSGIQASFSRRINRPNLWSLYPFNEVRDINVLQTGNPELDPTYTNGYELTFTHRHDKYSFNPGIYYRSSDQPFQTFLDRTEDDLFVLLPINIDQLRETGVEFTASYQPVAALQLSTDFNFYHFEESGIYEGQDLSANGTSWRARASANLRLPKDLQVQLYYLYVAPRNEAQVSTLSFSELSAGLSKSFMDDKIGLSIRAFNLLDSSIRRSVAKTTSYELEQSSRRYGARFTFTFVYKFNQTEKDRMRNAQRGNR
ncbi:TonB-dependent receptor domain-containing protein [Lewinella cohaerens]|uniref:TonB-dependent receptor domain-containing protein n=1 Tax=Lewinella cohaerens TaxID=70995 RepID=UPI000377BA56|nr:outer membrane beta-barrel family protein [Lewinella cohaerens]